MTQHRPLVLPIQHLKKMYEDGQINATESLADGQLQPSSLDLRLGHKAFRIQGSFVPGTSTVAEKLKDVQMYEVDLTQGAVLEKGAVYLVPLMEFLDLPPHIAAKASPKSSTGRLDIFTRVLTDHGEQFDYIKPGYNGPLYLEISPLTFTISVRTADKLSQIRFVQPAKGTSAAPSLNTNLGWVGENVWFSANLAGAHGQEIVGYRARRHAPIVDLSKIGHYDAEDFWEPITAPKKGQLILNPEDFYILASKEMVHVKADEAAEMVPYDVSMGELRVHYAGFFDPGFGCTKTSTPGAKAVLEVRAHDVPALLEDGQKVGRLVYDKMVEPAEVIYGEDLSSNYQMQGLKLGKHFK